MKTRRAHLAALGAVLLLAACADQQIRDRSQEELRDGRFEQAIDTLDRGLRKHPDSPLLRAGAVQARSEALSRLLTDAAAARAAGRFDDTLAILERARAFDPGDRRVAPLMADVEVERRQLAALKDAQALAAQGKADAALRLLAEALKDNPRRPELLALQRKLETQRRDALLRGARTSLAETRPVSLDFRDAGLRNVLDVVSRNSGINFILDKDIRPDIRVTVYLRSAKPEDAIDLIVSTNGLAKKVLDSKTLLIYPNTPEKQREHQEQVVKVFYLANGDPKGAAAFLRSMLKVRDPFVDERTGMLALRDVPDNIQLAERLIALYDAAEPEVLLELEVMEISSSRLTELGVQFPDTIALTALAPSSGGLTLDNIRGIGRDRIGLSVSSLFIHLKRSVGDVSTLSSPRIRVKSKEKAKVLIGDRIPIITATTGTGGFVSDSVSYVDVGLKLEVEPTVYLDDEVAIKIALEVSALGSQVKTASGSLAYQIGTRNASTLLRLRDGQTQLLAGLISRDERTSASRLPGLGDLPVLGRLFSDQSNSANRTELVLAVTPRVVRNLRQPDASESEMWVGTEASPRLRPPGGMAVLAAETEAAPARAAPAPAEPASSPKPAATKAAAAAPVASGPTTAQWTVPKEVREGEVFPAIVQVQLGAPARGASFHVGYPADRLSVVSVEEGSLFMKSCEATSFTHSVIAGERPEDGRVRGAVMCSGDATGAGAGTLVRINFKALKAGAVGIGLLGTDPIGAVQASPTALPAPASVTVH